jgi:hypothetical protein
VEIYALILCASWAGKKYPSTPDCHLIRPYQRTVADCETTAKKQFAETVRVEAAMRKEVSVPDPDGKYRNNINTNIEWYECDAIPADPATVTYVIVECFAADTRCHGPSDGIHPHNFEGGQFHTLQECGAAAAIQAGTNPQAADGTFVPGVVDVQPKSGQYHFHKAEQHDRKWYFPELLDDWLECHEGMPSPKLPLPIPWQSAGSPVKLL